MSKITYLSHNKENIESHEDCEHSTEVHEELINADYDNVGFEPENVEDNISENNEFGYIKQ